MALVYRVAHLVLSRTRFGRYTYAMGGNEEAARLSGVNVCFHKTIVYGVCGLTSAIAAVVLTARLNSAQPIAGIMYELDAIAAAVIGGTSLRGGEGTLAGTLESTWWNSSAARPKLQFSKGFLDMKLATRGCVAFTSRSARSPASKSSPHSLPIGNAIRASVSVKICCRHIPTSRPFFAQKAMT